MTAALWGAALLWALVFIYGIAGSVDFGAGFWAMVFYREKDAKAATIANRYLSPLWEVTNVFLVLFAVALVGLFPTAAYVLGNILLVPGNLILILLTLRTVFMVYAHTVDRYQKPLRVVSGVTGLLIPALLMTVLPIAQGNFLQNVGGRLTLRLGHLFTSPLVYAYVLLGLISELFLSAMLLADYARVAKDRSAYSIYRKYALWLGPLNMICALIALFSIGGAAPWLERSMLTQWPWFLASGLFFILGYGLSLSSGSGNSSSGSGSWSDSASRDKRLPRRFRLAVISHVLQYALAMAGYGRAHLPYLVYPAVTIQDSFTNSEMFRAVVVVLVIGVAVLFPGFVWFWRLFLENDTYASKPE